MFPTQDVGILKNGIRQRERVRSTYVASLKPSLWLHDPATRVAAWGCKLACFCQSLSPTQTRPSILAMVSLFGKRPSRRSGPPAWTPASHDAARRPRWIGAVLLAPLLVSALACRYPGLAPNAQNVAVTILPPSPSCERIAYIRGRAGSTWPPSELYPEPHQNGRDLLPYAMNDLRNRAVEVGANYVQRSEPTLSAPWGTITHAEYAGVAYRCASIGE